MARVTVEDCVVQVPNRFELVMIASQRAREIAGGAPLTIERDNDKNPVISLREIAGETVSLDTLRDAMVRGHQRVLPMEESEEDIIELMDGEQGWVRPATEPLEGAANEDEDELRAAFAEDDDESEEEDDDDLAFDEEETIAGEEEV